MIPPIIRATKISMIIGPRNGSKKKVNKIPAAIINIKCIVNLPARPLKRCA